MLDITNIPPPRVPLIDERTGLMSREWYRFFLNLFRLTGNGTNDTSLEDIQLAPKAQVESGDIEDIYIQSQLAGPASPELGTLAAENEDNVRLIGFSANPSPAIPNPAPVGTVYWNGGTTLNVQMTPNVVGNVNESAYYYIKASSAITKGDVVMFTGAVGASGVPTGAPATGVTDGSYIMGIAAESIALNGFGMVQYLGTLKGLNTSAFVDGDILWYNPAVTGGLTKTKPSAPNVKVQMAAVINAGSGGSGSLLIRVHPGSELGGTDSNVQFSALANGNIIQYDGTAGYWKNITTLGTANGGTGLTSFTNKGVVYANSTTTLTTSSGLQFDGTSLSVGTTTALSLIHGYSATSSVLRMEGDSTTQLLTHRASNSAAGPAWFLRKSRGSIASPSAVNSGDLIGSIQWSAYGGTNFRITADIRSYIDTYVSDTNLSSYMGFYTCPAGSSTATERIRITAAGNTYNVAGGSTGMTDGFFYIPAAAGAPTGVPTAIANTVPMYYDTTNNKFYVYNGAWKSVTLT